MFNTEIDLTEHTLGGTLFPSLLQENERYKQARQEKKNGKKKVLHPKP